MGSENRKNWILAKSLWERERWWWQIFFSSDVHSFYMIWVQVLFWGFYFLSAFGSIGVLVFWRQILRVSWEWFTHTELASLKSVAAGEKKEGRKEGRKSWNQTDKRNPPCVVDGVPLKRNSVTHFLFRWNPSTHFPLESKFRRCSTGGVFEGPSPLWQTNGYGMEKLGFCSRDNPKAQFSE
jgi:hypothetical protein